MAEGLLQDLKVTMQLPDKIQLPVGGGTSLDLRHVDRTAERLVEQATDMGLSVIVALLVVVVGWMISSRLATFTQRALIRTRVEETVAAFMGSMARYSLFLCCMIIAFKLLGVSLTSMVALFGAIGLAVAFALRGTLGHVAAGLMLIVNRPFKVGDFIELDKMMGTVKRITLFNTEINTLQNLRMFIPNSKIWENILQNHTYNEVRAIEMKIAFDARHDPAKCKAVLMKLFAAEPLVLSKPEPYIETSAWEGGAVVYLFRIWVKTREYGLTRGPLLDKIWAAAKKEGITPAYSQHIVQVVPDDVKKGTKAK